MTETLRSAPMRRIEPASLPRRTVLHVGCGPAHPDSLHKRFHGPHWREIRLDLDPGANPDIVASITDLHAIADDSVDAVWSSHNLEHLSAHEVPLALAEFQRVLAPGGFALITVPDLQQVAEFVVADRLEDIAYVSAAGPITPLDCIFGLGRAVAAGNSLMAHRTGFTETSLRRHLEQSSFVQVQMSSSPFALWAEALKPARSGR